MAALILAILFWFRLPDVSRTYLLLLFPVQFLAALATRAALRLSFRRMRARGLNQRFVLVVGAGPRGQAFAAKLESHRELGLAVTGFLDDDQSFTLPGRWRYRGGFADLEAVLESDVIDEVAVCLPFSRWDLVAPIVGIAEEHGKIVRVPMDVLDRSFTSGRVEDLDGTPVFSLVSGPDRALGLAAKRFIDLAGVGAPAGPPEPGAGRRRGRDPGQGRLAGALPPHAGGAPRPHVPLREVPDDGAGRRGPLRRGGGPRRPARLQARPTTRGSRRWAPSSGARAWTSCPSSGTSCAGR